MFYLGTLVTFPSTQYTVEAGDGHSGAAHPASQLLIRGYQSCPAPPRARQLFAKQS